MSLLNPKLWKSAGKFVDVKSLNKKISDSTPISQWINRGELSPLNIYLYLKTRFGLPNGPVSFLRKHDSGYDWDYLLRYEDCMIHVLQISSLLKIIVMGQELSASAWDTLLVNLKCEITDKSREIANAKKSLHSARVFANPFRRLNDTFEILVARCAEIDIENPPQLTGDWFSDEAEADAWIAELRDFSARIEQRASIHLCIRMVLPVLGECFVNILILVLCKAEVRKNRRLYENVLRQHIDVRVALLHLYCDGFARPVEMSHDAFKGFKRVMDGRNELLHGTVSPKKLAYKQLLLDPDGMIPLYNESSALPELFTQGLLHEFEEERAMTEGVDVARFMDFVLGHLDQPARKRVEEILDDHWPVWDDVTGEHVPSFSLLGFDRSEASMLNFKQRAAEAFGSRFDPETWILKEP